MMETAGFARRFFYCLKMKYLCNIKNGLLENVLFMKRLLFVVCLIFLSACQDAPEASWTFLVYLDGDNDLAEDNLADMEEMRLGNTSGEIRILVQFDQPDDVTAKRYEIAGGVIKELEDIGEVDMASGQTLTDFLLWSNQKLDLSSGNTVLILSDHGNGWDQMVGPSPQTKMANRSLFVDWDTKKSYTPSLHNHSVREAIEKAVIEFNMLGLDASIMGTIEAIYEFSDLADVIVSSQEVGYSAGWNYQYILSRLSKNTSMTTEDLGGLVVDSFEDYFENTVYASGQETSDQLYGITAHRSEGIKKIATRMNVVAESLLTKLNGDDQRDQTIELLQTSREDAQHIDLYNQPYVYVDLLDLQTKLGLESEISTLISDATIKHYQGKDRPQANGLSIVFFKFPKSHGLTYDKNYKNWDETTATGNKGKFLNEFQWDEMLKTYYGLAFPELEL